jgi:hypothetical protein
MQIFSLPIPKAFQRAQERPNPTISPKVTDFGFGQLTLVPLHGRTAKRRSTSIYPTQPPASLVTALKDYIDGLEGKKVDTSKQAAARYLGFHTI